MKGERCGEENRESCEEEPIAEWLWGENIEKGEMGKYRRRWMRMAAARSYGGWCVVNVDGEGLVDVTNVGGGRGGGR